jgi:hypothetical protein
VLSSVNPVSFPAQLWLRCRMSSDTLDLGAIPVRNFCGCRIALPWLGETIQAMGRPSERSGDSDLDHYERTSAAATSDRRSNRVTVRRVGPRSKSPHCVGYARARIQFRCGRSASGWLSSWLMEVGPEPPLPARSACPQIAKPVLGLRPLLQPPRSPAA